MIEAEATELRTILRSTEAGIHRLRSLPKGLKFSPAPGPGVAVPPHAGPAPRRSEGPSSPREEAIAPRPELRQIPLAFAYQSRIARGPARPRAHRTQRRAGQRGTPPPRGPVDPPPWPRPTWWSPRPAPRRGPGGPARPADHGRAARPARRQDHPGLLRRGLRRGPDDRPRSRRRSSCTSASSSPTRSSGCSTSTRRPIEPRPVEPRDTDRVFVDVTAYNSKVYYVQGDVAQPGRLPITGNETVLDAINYAGGLIPTAAPQNIRLVRRTPGPAASRSCRSTTSRSPAGATRRPTTSSCPAIAWSSTATRRPLDPPRPLRPTRRTAEAVPPHPIRCLAGRSPAHRGGTKARPAPGGRGGSKRGTKD